MPLLYASEPVHFNSPAESCDCLTHVYGKAADHPDRCSRYPSDMTDAEPGEGTFSVHYRAACQDLALRENGGSLGLGRLGYFLPALLAHTPLQLVQPLVEECADLLVARIVVA